MNDDWVRNWKESLVAYFKIIGTWLKWLIIIIIIIGSIVPLGT